MKNIGIHAILGLAVVVTGIQLHLSISQYVHCWTGPAGCTLLFVVPATTFLGFGTSLLLKFTYKVRAALIAASLGVVCLFLEGSLALLRSSPLRLDQRQEASGGSADTFDLRSKTSVINSLRSEGIHAVPTIPSVPFRRGVIKLIVRGRSAIPLAGISRSQTVFCNESGRWACYESDEHGFRNPLGLYRPGRVDIAAIGDSFVHGACVSCEEELVSRIRSTYPQTINLGYASQGPLCKLAVLTEYALPLKPKVVLWFHYEGNDLRDLQEEANTDLLRYLQADYQLGLLNHQAEIDQQLFRIVERSAEFDFRQQVLPMPRFVALPTLRRHLRNAASTLDSSSPSLLKIYGDVLGTARRRVEALGARFLFVYLPCYERFSEAGLHGVVQRDSVRSIIDKLEVSTIDILPVFERHSDPLSLFPFRVKGHYTAEGYKIVANTVLKSINGQLQFVEKD